MYEVIKTYSPKNPIEESDKIFFLEAISLFGMDLFNRHKMMHFTASSMIFNDQLDRVLMIYHKLYNSWSWTGGHMDGDLNFLEVATKEAKEETGLINLKLYSETPVSIESLPVWFHIKHDKPISSHLHLNVSYVFIASDTEKLILNAVETEGLKWILIKDLKDYVSEPDMIPIYEKIIKRVMI